MIEIDGIRYSKHRRCLKYYRCFNSHEMIAKCVKYEMPGVRLMALSLLRTDDRVLPHWYICLYS